MGDEIQQLKEELEKQRARCARLEDELDDLAVDNDRLRKLLAATGGNPSASLFTAKNVTSHSQNTGTGLASNNTSNLSGENNQINDADDWQELLQDGDDNCSDIVHTTIPNACGGMNVLCVAFCPYPGAGSLALNPLYEAFVCGGVDKTLRIYGTSNEFQSDLSKPKILLEYKLSAPILAIDCVGRYIACSMMDGSHAVIDISTPPTDATNTSTNNTNNTHNTHNTDHTHSTDITDTVSNVTIFTDHTKYVVTIKWSPDGDYLATVSHDKTVNLYKKIVSADGKCNMIKVHTARFMVTPEFAIFAKNSKKVEEYENKKLSENENKNNRNDVGDDVDVEGGGDDDIEKVVKEGEGGNDGGGCDWELIIALRDTSYLVYLHCGTYVQRHITLNENKYDTHCSFTPLHLAVSPNKKYLLIATDKNFHFIVKIGSFKRLRFLAGGHSSGDYGKPRVAWDCTGKYVYCNNEEGTSISVYSVAAEKCVRSLSVHTGSVRDVICHPKKPIVATGSYDKSVIIFTAAMREGFTY